MSRLVYLNGQFVEHENAKVHVYDHGFLYGDGVFEGLRIYGGKVFKLHEHLVRLYESAAHICLQIPLTIEEMTKAVVDSVAANKREDGYIRLVVTRGVGNLGLDPRSCPNPQVIIIVDGISLYPKEMYENGMEIVTASTIRNHPNALNPRIKSLNYLNNIMGKLEAIRAGVPEALMLNHFGEIAECTADNIFIVSKGILRTPHKNAGILEGVTRNTVLDLARENGIPVEETTLTRHDLFTSQECFLTGSGAEIIPVTKCDNRVIGSGKPGAITLKLIAAFFKLVRS
jgi:branched-chain amino acid aminotransferase